MKFGQEMDAAKLLVLMRIANLERPKDEQAYIEAVGPDHEPVHMVEVRGELDLGRLAELLNKMALYVERQANQR
jgi:hypothetical protein